MPSSSRVPTTYFGSRDAVTGAPHGNGELKFNDGRYDTTMIFYIYFLHARACIPFSFQSLNIGTISP